MKLNFWQWLAVALLIVGCVWWVYDWSHEPKVTVPAPPANAPATQNVRPQ